MAIGARVSPELIAHGTVLGHRSYDWEGEHKGTRVTVDTDGGPLVVLYRTRDEGGVPSVGEVVSIVASVFDGSTGSSLTFERVVTPDDLDRMGSALQVA